LDNSSLGSKPGLVQIMLEECEYATAAHGRDFRVTLHGLFAASQLLEQPLQLRLATGGRCPQGVYPLVYLAGKAAGSPGGCE
jgi:hypothetical protein